MPWKFLEDVAIADIAFEVEADSLDALFVEAGKATEDMIVDMATVKKTRKETVTLEAETIERLLYDWIAELIYLKDTEGLLCTAFEVSIKKNTTYTLHATLHGEEIDRKRHDLRNDVKAVTMHMFEVKQNDKKWMARVVVDV